MSKFFPDFFTLSRIHTAYIHFDVSDVNGHRVFAFCNFWKTCSAFSMHILYPARLNALHFNMILKVPGIYECIEIVF